MEKVYKMYGSIYIYAEPTNYDLEELCDTYDVALRGNIKVITSYSVHSQRPQ